MSKKTTNIISVILFLALAALMVCEVNHPAGGAAMLASMMHYKGQSSYDPIPKQKRKKEGTI